MTTYADATRCPDCHAALPRDPQVCRVCSLPLTGDTAVSLFRTLQEADRLVGVLREQRRPVNVAAGTPTTAPGSLLEGIESYPAPGRPVQGGSPRISGLSVPRVLLSLGALCLLVAAVTFLAFAWSWLGVGGRTVVLVALTGASLGLSVVLLRRALRMAAEALSIVGLGLLAIDVVGGRHAGWLGTIDNAQLTLITGTVVAAGALTLLALSAQRPLIAPALVAPVAVLVATVGAQGDTRSPVPTVIALVVLLGLGRVGTALPSAPLAATSMVVGAITWLGLLAVGADHAGDPVTVSHYWGDAGAWPLLTAVAIAVLVGPATGLARGATTTGYALGAVLGSYVVVAPALDNHPDSPVVSLLGAAVVWSAVLLAAPARWRAAPALAVAGVVPWPLVAAVRLLEDSGRALTAVGDPFTQPFAVHVTPTPHDVSPWLLPVALVVLGAAACALARLVIPASRVRWAVGVGAAGVTAALATPALYDVPLALPVGLALAVAAAALAVAGRMPEASSMLTRALAAVLVTGTVLLALPSNGLTTVALVIATAGSALLISRADLTGSVALVVFPLAFAGLVWAAADVAQVDEQYRAMPVILVLGGMAIWRPRVELEVSAALAGAVAAAGAITYATDPSVALAVYLTVAGVLVTASSIVHPSRRLLAWPGGLLLAAATWVRLIEIGVHVPEAYTLPSALALTAVGAWRLRRDDRSATLTVLAPGLTLATVPSLVAMLDDPYSLRALLLGVACLALALAGSALRWSAPLVVGAAVGGLLVLRELAPYAAQVPTWVSIGASGALLLAVGITWESRMNDARRASRYVGALR